MKGKFYINTEDGCFGEHQEYEAYDAVQEFAADFYYNHDGWECMSNSDLKVVVKGHGTFNINTEFEPSFSVLKV